MDGATGLGEEQLLPGASDAAWLVQRVNAFRRAHADDASLGMVKLFAGAIDDVQVDTFHVIAEDRLMAWAMDEGLDTVLAAVSITLPHVTSAR